MYNKEDTHCLWLDKRMGRMWAMFFRELTGRQSPASPWRRVAEKAYPDGDV